VRFETCRTEVLAETAGVRPVPFKTCRIGGINFYTRGKLVTSRWPDPARSKVDLGFARTR
jgi:hypothetical protein